MSEARRLPHLDGLRGVASIMVLFNHLALCVIPSISTLKPDVLSSQTLIDIGRSPLSVLWGGDFGVCIFFVLSGFVLTQFSHSSALNFSSMLLRRYARLALPMLASTLIGYLLLRLALYRNVAAATTVSHSEWQALWYHFPPSLVAALDDGLFGAFLHGLSDYNCNLWTMQIELIGSAAIFALYCLQARTAWRILALLVLIMLLPGYYPLFAIGTLLFEVHLLVAPLMDGLRRRYREPVAAALFLAAIFAGGFPASGPHTGIVSSWHQWLSESDNAQAWHMIGATLMMAAALSSQTLAAALASRPGRFLGELSFPIYLIQIPLLCSLTSWLMIAMSALPYEQMAAATMLITVVATLGAAQAMSRFVEMPSVQLSRQIGRFLNNWGGDIKRFFRALELRAAVLFERRAFRRCILLLQITSLFRTLSPQSLAQLAACRLIVGDERRAVRHLRSAAEADTFYWNSDIDIERRPRDDGAPRLEDTSFGDPGLRFAGYNYAAMRAFQIGAGHLSTGLAERAVGSQPLLKTIARPGQRVVDYLSAHNLRMDDIRIMPLSWVMQIGHLGMLDLMLRMRRLGWWSGTAVILAPPTRVANPAFLSLLSAQPNVITVTDAADSLLMYDFEALLRSHGLFYHAFRPPGAASYVRWHEAAAMALHHEPTSQAWTLIDTFDEQFAGQSVQNDFQRAMAEWGIGENDWYVCLHLRELGYHPLTVDTGQANRNAEFENYSETIRFIAAKGGRVIKMGSPHGPAQPETPGLIDYAHSPYKSAAMDIALIRHARYFIGTTSGLANVAISFGIPTAQVNCITTEYQPWTSSVRFCPKLVRKRSGQILTQRELTSAPRWWLATRQSMVDAGFASEDNSPDEILETVREVDALAAGQHGAQSAIIERWKRHLAVPHAYGSALPSVHFLDKHGAAFLRE